MGVRVEIAPRLKGSVPFPLSPWWPPAPVPTFCSSILWVTGWRMQCSHCCDFLIEEATQRNWEQRASQSNLSAYQWMWEPVGRCNVQYECGHGLAPCLIATSHVPNEDQRLNASNEMCVPKRVPISLLSAVLWVG